VTTRRGFGNVRHRASGRWQARCKHRGVGYSAETTFSTKRRAEAELGRIERDIEAGRWTPPVKGARAAVTAPQTLRSYADAGLAERTLSPTTRDHYRQVLRDHILPAFGDLPVPEITASVVRTWHARLLETTNRRTGRKVGPTARAHAYGLLRTIMTTAISDELIPANSCRVHRGGSARTAKRMRPATLAELDVIVAATPERFRLMVLLAVWCSLRFSEPAELRRGDVDVKAAVVRVRRASCARRTAGW
jgi:integrase